jgi:hypothetical protein
MKRPNTRSVVGGPKMVHRHIGPHQVHTFTFHLVPNTVSRFGVAGTHPLHVNVKAHQMLVNGEHLNFATNWVLPRRGKEKTVPVTVHIRNNHKKQARYELILQ